MQGNLTYYTSHQQCVDDAMTLYRLIKTSELLSDHLAVLNKHNTDIDGRSFGGDLEDVAVMLSNAADALRGHIRWHLDLDADKPTTKAA